MKDASVILLDVPEGGGQFERELLERFGHEVIVCHGPEQKQLCPILAKDGSCPLFEQAHGIVFELDLDRPMHRAILRSYADVTEEAGIPVRVVVTPDQAVRFADELTRVEVWTHEPSAGELDGFSSRVAAYERGSAED